MQCSIQLLPRCAVDNSTPLSPEPGPCYSFLVLQGCEEEPANAAGFLASCWLSLCPRSQLPTHSELLQQCCIMKHSPFQGFHPLTVQQGWGKCHCINVFPKACSEPEHCLPKMQGKARQTVADSTRNCGLSALAPGKARKRDVCTRTQPQLHALWISAHIPNPTIVNFFWLLLEIDRESNKQITAESLMAFPAPWTGSHKGNHVSPRYRSENEERHHSAGLTG